MGSVNETGKLRPGDVGCIQSLEGLAQCIEANVEQDPAAAALAAAGAAMLANGQYFADKFLEQLT
jgi:hypothetical protein